ncbi:hypothetical protein PM082_020807 [Marasmius tenuissimus]|nr:hypothetical protein PM082_020807 [Marasmius tenuissimus]
MLISFPSTPPAPSQNLGTIDIDASDNETPQAGPSKIVECRSSDDDSSDAVSVSEEHVPTHDSPFQESSYVVPNPPEVPQANPSSDDNDDFEPPPASAEEINRSRCRSASSSDEEGETAPVIKTRPLISRANYEDVEMSRVDASEPAAGSGFTTNNMTIHDEASDGEEDDKDIEEHSMSNREVKEHREALSSLKSLGNPRVPCPCSETPPPIPPSAVVIKTQIGRTVNAPRRPGSSTAVIPTMRPSSGLLC